MDKVRSECGSCGKVVYVPPEYAGRRGKCRSCGAVVNVPGADSEPESLRVIAEPATRRSKASDSAVDVGLGRDVASLRRRSGSRPREPWFYGFMAFNAWFSIAVALLIAVPAVVLGVMNQVWVTVAVGVGLVFVVSVLVAPVLVVVDMARNIRMMRIEQRERASDGS